MSTNKTENYHLHAWEPQDDFLLSEINENFAAIDGAIPELVTGGYQGMEAEGKETICSIQLGFQPRAVFIMPQSGTLDPGGGRRLCGLFSIDRPMTETTDDAWAAHITPTGFEYRNKRYILLNFNGYKFTYWAIR